MAADEDTGNDSKKKDRRRNLRVKKRTREDSEEDSDGLGNRATAATRTTNNRTMTFTTKASNARDEKGFHVFESTGMEAAARQDDATRTMEDVGVRKLGGAGGGGPGQLGDVVDTGAEETAKGQDVEGKTYRGMQNYTDYRQNFRNEAERAGAGISERPKQAGPARPSANYRMTVVVDYQPDVCKDFKETGFCGFGDTCKFLHDRSDYKAGWQLDRDWDEAQKAKREKEARFLLGEVDDEDEGTNDKNDMNDNKDKNELPFACLMCKELWASCRDPVVTRCGHYFCEACALKQNAKTGKCFACGKGTRGIFNSATDIIKQFKPK